jgi:hypothetical protein
MYSISLCPKWMTVKVQQNARPSGALRHFADSRAAGV